MQWDKKNTIADMQLLREHKRGLLPGSGGFLTVGFIGNVELVRDRKLVKAIIKRERSKAGGSQR